MRFTVFLSIILFVVTIWCAPDDDVFNGTKALIVAHRKVPNVGVQILVLKLKNGKGYIFPRGKEKERDEGDPLKTACRELIEETGYEMKLGDFQDLGWVDNKTLGYYVEIPHDAVAGPGVDRQTRENLWVDPIDVHSCVAGRDDSALAWYASCGRIIKD